VDNEQPTFKCKECGATGLCLEYRYDWVQRCSGELECRCGERHDFAAIRRYEARTSCVERSVVEECHHFNLNRAIIEEVSERKICCLDVDDVLCEECFENAKEEDWSEEPEEPDGDMCGPFPLHEDVYVRCAGCDREIEFGWDRPPDPWRGIPDRGIPGIGRGLVYPAECSDFDPRKCWPDSKYEEKWRERGWCGKTSDNSS